MLHKASRFAAAWLYLPDLLTPSASAERGAVRASVYSLCQGALRAAWLLVAVAFDFLTGSTPPSPAIRFPPALQHRLDPPARGRIRVGPIAPDQWSGAPDPA